LAFDRDKAFEVSEDGFLLENGVHIISGPDTPIALAINPTNPTVFLQTNGAIWYHTGAGSWARSGSLNFSFHKINGVVVIPDGQQMVTYGSFEVTPTGCFEIEDEAKFKIEVG